jgi:hypothetical protein
MHPLERRLLKLEPRPGSGDGSSTIAMERLLERLSGIRERARGATINESLLSLAEIMAGVPCSEAAKGRLWDFLKGKGISAAAIEAIRASLEQVEYSSPVA